MSGKTNSKTLSQQRWSNGLTTTLALALLGGLAWAFSTWTALLVGGVIWWGWRIAAGIALILALAGVIYLLGVLTTDGPRVLRAKLSGWVAYLGGESDG